MNKRWVVGMFKRQLLILFSVSLCVMALSQLQIALALPYTDIDVDTAHDMITSGLYPNLVILDVRNQSEFYSGHLYDAILIPVAELEERIGELAGHENHEIIVYCRSGYRSATASGILDAHGFTKVYNMLGGITAWVAAGYPITPAATLSVTVSTDKTTYSPGDTMSVSIGLTNPGTAVDVIFVWYLWLPRYGYWLPITAVPLPLSEAYDETFPIPLPVGDWGGTSFVACWVVALLEPSCRCVLGSDYCVWTYRPCPICPGAPTTPEAFAERVAETAKNNGLSIPR